MPTASGKAGVAQRELAAIHVGAHPRPPRPAAAPGAAGPAWKWASSGVARRYDLSVGFGISGEGIAIQPDSTATRIRAIGSATWTLIAQDPAEPG